MYKKYQANFLQQKLNFALRLLQNKEYTYTDVSSNERLKQIAGLNNGFYLFKSLRNSPMYMEARKSELYAFIRQYGIPTWFISLSAADFRWNDLLRSLSIIIDGVSLTDQEITKLNFHQKCRLINTDPVTTARYFDNRMKIFIQRVLYHHTHPIGYVIDHFYKIEFQHRGTPHVHMLIWIDQSPKFDEDKTNQEVLEFIDKYTSCSSDIPTSDMDYINIQKHSHSRTCRKKNKNICRFGYPIPPMRQTTILKPLDDVTDVEIQNYKKIVNILNNDSSILSMNFDEFISHLNITETEYIDAICSSLRQHKIFLRRQPADIRINSYMRNLYKIWEANHDIQFCTNAYSVITYIVTYIQKTNRGLSLSLSHLVKQMKHDGPSIQEQIKKIGHVFVHSTEISIQECVYMLLGLPMCYISRDVVYISIHLPHERIKVLKEKQFLEQLSEDSTDVCYDTLYDKYEERPICMEQYCFADYICKINVTKCKNDDDTDMGGSANIITIMDNKKYTIRRKSKVLRYNIPSKRSDLNERKRIDLLLFHPWRNEKETFSEGQDYTTTIDNMTTEEREQFEYKIREYNTESQEVLEDLQEQAQEIKHTDSIAPNIQHLDDETKEQHTGSTADKDFFIPKISTQTDQSGRDISTRSYDISQREMVHVQVEKIWEHTSLLSKIQHLNEKQTEIYEHIMKNIILYDTPLHIFITGGAGVGKSEVLHVLYQSLSRFYNLQPNIDPHIDSVMCLSYTGKAAFLIRGETIHSALGIQPSATYAVYISPGSEVLNRLRNRWKNVRVVLIDEISFVGATLFNFMNLRFQEIMGTTELFGGLHIITFGDLYQLAPVCGKWIFLHGKGATDVLGTNLWREHFKYYELTEIMRQKDDKPFAEMLNRIRKGVIESKDMNILDQQISHIDLTQEELPQILCSKNTDVNRYNAEIYEHSPNHKCVSISTDYVISNMSDKKGKQYLENLTKDATKTGCLEQRLALCENLTYDIIINLDVTDGLANGTSGRLKKIQYFKGIRNPAILWFDFTEKYIGVRQRKTYKQFYIENIDTSWTPILPITRKFNIGKKFVEIARTQFPLKQSSAKTVHKSQGSTYDQIIVDVPGPYYSFIRHIMYVALSRVKTLEGLTLKRFDQKSIKTDIRVTEENDNGIRTRYVPIQEHIISPQSGILNIHYENTQSLIPHFENVKKCVGKNQYDIIALCETRLSNTETDNEYNIEGYTMIRLDSRPSTQNRTPHGLLIYVRDTICVNSTNIYSTINIEALAINITYDTTTYKIILLYKTPTCTNENLFTCLQWCKQLYTTKDNIIIVGDFNTDTNDQKKHHTLKEIMGILDLDIVHTEPTTKNRTTLDFYLTNCQITTYVQFIQWSLHFSVNATIYPKK